MVISTFGTKICDDALVYSGGKIKNANRIVEVSPFTIHEKFCGGVRKIKEKLPFSHDNAYLYSVFEKDYRKEITESLKDPKAGIVVIDMMVCRRLFREFKFEDEVIYRITEDDVLARNIENVRRELETERGVKIKSEHVCNPMKMSPEELETEIELFAQTLKENIGEERLVLLKAHNALHFIDKTNRIDIFPNPGNISNFNEFYDKCVDIFEKYVSCKVIEMPEQMICDSRIKMAYTFHFTRNYYNYVLECLYAMEQGNYSDEESRRILDAHNNREKIFVEEVLYNPVVDLTKHRSYGRKIILIGNCEVYEYNLMKKYGMTVYKRVSYDRNSTMESIMEQLEDVKYQSKEYVIAVPYIYPKTKLLEAVWRCGYAMNRDCLCNFHPIYRLNNFVGSFKDIYNNEISSNRLVNIEMCGIGCSIGIEASKDTNPLKMTVYNQADISIGNGITLEKEGITSLFYDGACAVIGKNVKMCNRVHIRNSFFNTVIIGDDTVICEDSTLMNGDGHAILDLHTGKNINYDLNNSKPEKHRIVIGKGTYIGIGAFILSGTRLGDKCVVRDRAFVNKSFEENSYIGGQPAQSM